MNELSFLVGYLAKTAAGEEFDLPSGSWYKGLIGDLGKHQSGRAQAVSEAQGKEAPWLTRHPYWGDILGATGGAVAGGAAGAGIGAAAGGEKGAVIGALAGGIGTPIATVLALALIRQKQTKTIGKEFGKSDPAALRQAIDSIAGKGGFRTGAKGLFTGSYDIGRAEQLANLAGKDDEVGSGYVVGAAPAAVGALQAASPTGGIGLQSMLNIIYSLKGRDMAKTTQRKLDQKPVPAAA